MSTIARMENNEIKTIQIFFNHIINKIYNKSIIIIF